MRAEEVSTWNGAGCAEQGGERASETGSAAAVGGEETDAEVDGRRMTMLGWWSW